MNWKVILVVVACFLLLVTSQLVRAQGAKENCRNVETLRDAMDNIVTLADEQTPPNKESDEFYSRSHEELRKVTC